MLDGILKFITERSINTRWRFR